MSDEEVTKLVSNSLQSMRNIFPEFDQFSFTPRTIPDSDSGEPHSKFIFYSEFLEIITNRYYLYLYCVTSGGHVRDVRGPGDDQQVADSEGQPRQVHPAGQARIQVILNEDFTITEKARA